MAGFSADQLRDKALLALEEAIQESRYHPVRRTLALRFALAFLWARSGGDRSPYDECWRALTQEDLWRFSAAESALGAIYRALGIERDERIAMMLWKRCWRSSRSPTERQ